MYINKYTFTVCALYTFIYVLSTKCASYFACFLFIFFCFKNVDQKETEQNNIKIYTLSKKRKTTQCF